MDNKTGLETLREFTGDLIDGSLCYHLSSNSKKKWGAKPLGITLNDKLREIADKIEADMTESANRQLPDGVEWPQFEDGAMVKFGDEILAGGENTSVKKISLYCNGDVVIFGETDMIANAVRLEPGRRVKRPDTLAADGLPIKVGETVYTTFSGKAHVVESIDHTYLYCGCGVALRVDCATHTPPDTQERIDADSALMPNVYLRDILHHPSWGNMTKDQARHNMITDLLRRQRELLRKSGE